MTMGPASGTDQTSFALLARIDEYIPSDAYINEVKESLTPEWSCTRSGPWLQVLPTPCELPTDGWKIHVSATPNNGLRLLKRALGVIATERLAFKVLLDPQVLRWSLGRFWSRPAVGKFMTIYPLDQAAFLRIIAIMAHELTDFEGPYILSDRPYPGSRCVFYRYGAIRPESSKDDGTSLVAHPNGTLVPDLRAPWYQQPEWVEDPIDSTRNWEREARGSAPVLLNDRYEVAAAIKQTGARSVYLGRDRATSRQVVVKEARALTDWSSDGLDDAVAKLRREAAVGISLIDCPVTPTFVEHFELFGNGYLVEEYEGGAPLHTVAAGFDNPLLLAWKPGECLRYSIAFRDMAIDYVALINRIWRNLVEAIRDVHNRHWAIGDLNSRNVLVAQSGDVKFIDLEGAFRPRDGEVGTLYEPGYASAQHARVGARQTYDDYYGLAASALDMILPINRLSVLSRAAWARVLAMAEQLLGVAPGPLEDLVRVQARSAMDGATASQVAQTMRSGLVVKSHRVSSQRRRPSARQAIGRQLRDLAVGVDHLMDLGKTPVIPTDRAGFDRASLGLGYGAAGALLALRAGGLHARARAVAKWLSDRADTGCAVGLFDGAAGISWSLLSGPDPDQADPWLDVLTDRAVGDRADATIFSGDAGITLGLLNAEAMTGRAEFGALARITSARLADLTEHLDGFDSIPNGGTTNGVRNPTGLLYGRTGIALALIEAAHRFSDQRLQSHACVMLDQELNFLYSPRPDMFLLSLNGEHGNRISHSQYWGTGGGLAYVLSRCYQLDSTISTTLKLDPLDKLTASMCVRLTVSPGWHLGMAGIANCLLNVAYYQPDRSTFGHEMAAEQLLAAACSFRVTKKGIRGTYVPATGDASLISCDFLTGSSGLIVAMQHLLSHSRFALEPGLQWTYP